MRSGKNVPKKDDATTPAGEEDEEGGTVGGFKEAGEALTDTSAQDEPTPAPRSHRRRDSPSVPHSVRKGSILPLTAPCPQRPLAPNGP